MKKQTMIEYFNNLINNKWFIFTILLISLSIFILEVFVFHYPDGTLGLITVIILSEFILFSTIQLYRLSNRFKEFIRSFFEYFV